MNTFNKVSLPMSILLLTACTTSQETIYTAYPALQQNAIPYYHSSTLYNLSDYNSDSYERANVTLPDSYHVGTTHSPTRAKDIDKRWVNEQNPQGYTILIADDERAATVAKKLYLLPKKDRMAEVKYQRNGKNYYQGVYGSYNSQQDAQAALDSLPPEIKQQAGVKAWNSVQSNLTD